MLCHTPIMAWMVGFAEPGRPPSSGSIDHETLPIRCHWEDDADAERCTDVLTYAAISWEQQIDRAGFVVPAPDEDGIVDLYLYSFSGGGGYASCSSWQDADPDDGLTGCPGYLALDPGISDAEMPTYVAHEFNHILQYAIDLQEPTYPVWEGIASAFEIWTFPEDVQLTIDYSFSDFQATPWAGLLSDGYFLWDVHRMGSAYEYGAAIWGLHLDHHHGDGGGAGAGALWLALAQRGTNTIDVIDGYDAVTGDWQDALLGLSAERILLGTPAAPDWLPQQQAQLRIALDGSYTSADLPLIHTPTVMPYSTGAIYVRLTGVSGPLEIAAEAKEGQWGIVVAQGAALTWEAAPTLRWSGEDDGDGSIVVGLVNLDHDAYATTGLWADLRASQREVLLHIAPAEELPDPEDTGLVDDPQEDTGETDSPPPEEDEDPDEEAEAGDAPLTPKGGCAAVPALPASLVGLAIGLGVLLTRRRPRPAPAH